MRSREFTEDVAEGDTEQIGRTIWNRQFGHTTERIFRGTVNEGELVVMVAKRPEEEKHNTTVVGQSSSSRVFRITNDIEKLSYDCSFVQE